MPPLKCPRSVRAVALLTLLSVPAAAFAAEPEPTTAAAPPPPPSRPALRPLGEVLLERWVQRTRQPDYDENAARADLAEVEEFLASRTSERTREVAQVRFFQATMTVTFLRDHQRGMPMLQQLAADFTGTDVGNELVPHLQRLWDEAENQKRIADMIGKAAPPLTFSWTTDELNQSLEDLYGFVVVLDFWVSDEGLPSRTYGKAFPELRDLVKRYEGYDVKFVAVTELRGYINGLGDFAEHCEDDPAREYALMKQFIARHQVTWDVAFSEDGVYDRRYGIRGIPYTVIIAPDGTIRRSDYFNVIKVADRAALIDELLREEELDVPPAG